MSKNEIVDEFVETKLTKSEVIDLLMFEMIDDQEKVRDAADIEHDKIQQSYTYDMVSSLLKRGEIEVSYYTSSKQDKKDPRLHIHVSVDCRLSDRYVSAELRDHVNKERAAVAALEETEHQLEEMKNARQKAKSTIIRSFLESTERGRKFLDQLGAMRVTLRKMLPARAST